jgi:hypothetical protein
LQCVAPSRDVAEFSVERHAALSEREGMAQVFKRAHAFEDKHIQHAIVHQDIGRDLKVCSKEGGIAIGYLNGIK